MHFEQQLKLFSLGFILVSQRGNLFCFYAGFFVDTILLMYAKQAIQRLLVWVMTLEFVVAYVYVVQETHRFVLLTHSFSSVVLFQKANQETLTQDIPALIGFEILNSEKITITNFTTPNATAVTITHPRETINKKNNPAKRWEGKNNEAETTRTTEEEMNFSTSLKSTARDETSWRMTLVVNETIASPLATQA